MKEELIQKLIEYIEKSKDFLLEQAPDVLQQMLDYEKFDAILGMIVCLSISFIGFGWAIFYWKKDKFLASVGIWGGGLLLAAGFTSCLAQYVKITKAPKYYILQQLTRK